MSFFEISNQADNNEFSINSSFSKIKENFTENDGLLDFKNSSLELKEKHLGKFISFLQKDADFYALVKEKLTDDDLQEITKQKLRKNMTCEQIDDLLKKCELFIDFLENQDATKILSEISESLDVVGELLNKIVEIEANDSESKENTYQGLFFKIF